ncbi:hypothetical protein D9Q98_009576 [Chlorella vulgaris]|uniref:mitogen-activated protein kinase kinase kinase n=1 Tax=Chlorella vulgaris TaxID=3077 RepID=A0A9D4TFF7_CHLVU|nr:hypothetical protein D9Q98_009576 [Chlorella vulgaris]
MGQCMSAQPHDTPERFKGRWQQGGLADGLSAFGGTDKYGTMGGEAAKPTYTTADVGLGPKARDDNFGFANDKPAPLQLERIDEDVTLRGGPDSSPQKPQGSAAPVLVSCEGGGCGGRPGAQLKPINWTRGEQVGQGAFGSVFVAMDNDTGELIAVKQVHIPRGGGAHAKKVEDNIRSVEDEVHLLQDFDHPNIVRYLGTEKTEDSLNIFLEYVPGGSIASLLAKFGSFQERVVRVYTKQILLGLEYLHSKGVMHRDIKGANILVDNTGLVKVADFGASKKLENLVTVDNGNKSVKGTPYWMAPEVITQTGHGRQADLWSVACTVLEMATGRPPWSQQYPSQVAAMFHIASCKGPPEIPQHLSPECKDFLYLCFNRDWKARPQASTLLRHPFLADVPLRSYLSGGPSPNAAALAQAAVVQRAPRISPPAVDTSAGPAQQGETTAALSPLGHHAVSRQQQWDTALAQQQQQQQQQHEEVVPPLVLPPIVREHSAVLPAFSGRKTGSPVKRAPLSLRASAPAFSGYAAIALSQQGLEPVAALPSARAAAASTAPPTQEQHVQPQQQQQQGSNLRSSIEDSSSLHELSSGSGSGSGGLSAEVSGGGSQPATAALPSPQTAADVAAVVAPSPQAASEVPAPSLQPPAAAAAPGYGAAKEGDAGSDSEAPAAGSPGGHTPAAARRLRGPALTPASTSTGGGSSSTSKSDYNPMEEPSWMHPLESPLVADASATPTSALTGGGGGGADAMPEVTQLAGALAMAGQEAHSRAAEADDLPEQGAAAVVAVGGAEAVPTSSAALPAEAVMAAAPDEPALPPAAASVAAPVPAEFGEQPPADHLVWTNEDGDIDALPWDMGGWSTGSSAQREGSNGGCGDEEEACALPALHGDKLDGGVQQQQPPPQQQQLAKQQGSKPAGEDALIGALRRKAQHDVRASLALFEKSLNIPAVHQPPSPKSAAAAAALAGGSPPGLGAPPRAAHMEQLPPTAQSIESRGSGGAVAARRSHHRQQQQQQQVAAAPDDSRRRLTAAAAAQALGLAGRGAGNGSDGGALPHVSPLAAAMGGLSGLGYAGAGRAVSGGGGDRESIWQQELSQELFRVKAGTGSIVSAGATPARRVSQHGSPVKRPGSLQHAL